ncbi:MAG: DUF2927 domain-containing protein [Proteobacteria bacterium]|nr:DUF2927 domain-containing protein [Pseudomonadota bacterium]MBS0574151.1 DUF2927 domain-containing protein [Pseudomonadota bacterium]
MRGAASPHRLRASCRTVLAALALTLATACVPPPPAGPATTGGLAAPGAAAPAVDAETRAAQDHYRRIEAYYRAQGLLRTDGGGPDTPFSASDLARNFLNIAFFDEFTERGGRLVEGGAQNVLHRWQGPLRVEVRFGPSVPPAERTSDSADVAAYFARLSRLTGLRAEMVTERANFVVWIANPAERRTSAPQILAFAPEISRAALSSATGLTPDIYCTVFSFSPGRSPVYDRAFAVIRAELPPLLRRSCFHEELAQALGLVNDSPWARPSIFNDNQEFAYLTRQDELMLRLLYDLRLRPGMTLEEARPIVARIAAELTGEPPSG